MKHDRLVAPFLHPFIRLTAALLACVVTATLSSAQMTQANYPLLTDLNDTTMNFGPMTLEGSMPPNPPAGGVCLNGEYLFNGQSNGQDVQTPNIVTLDENDFELSVEFQVAALESFPTPIVVGGNGWRWIGFLVNSSGELGLLHNNAQQEWSTTMITIGQWHSGLIKYEMGTVELYLDGQLALTANIGPLVTGNNLNFVTNNFSNGTAFEGCIRNLVIANNTTLGPPGGGNIGMNYCGPAQANSTGNPGVISAFGSANVLPNDVTLTASDLPNNSFGFFLTSQTQGLTMNPGGSMGHLCLGGAIGRYVGPGQIQNSGSAGEFSLLLDLTMTPTPTGFVPIQAGETWNFTSWHRDAVGGSATSNFTDAIEVTFQ